MYSGPFGPFALYSFPLYKIIIMYILGRNPHAVVRISSSSSEEDDLPLVQHMKVAIM